MNRFGFLFSTFFVWTFATAGSARATQSATDSPEALARTAMDHADYVQAISILSDALALRPTADAFLNLSSAFRHTQDWRKAEDTLIEGEKRFPADPRIPTELAGTYLEDRDVPGARNALHRALEIDPKNVPAADLIAAVELSEGEIQTALRFWNRSGRPVVNEVLHNLNVGAGHWTVRKASLFHHGKMMTYSQWRTTQLRLEETGIFSNVGFDIEPAPASSQFNPVILTSKKTNDLVNVGFGLLKGAPLKTSYFDWWDAANSGITLNSSYRWDYNRKRGELQLHVPVPLPGIFFINAAGVWRSERWDVTPVLRTDAGINDRFQYDSTGVRVELKYVPRYKFDFGTGFEYTNRNASGGPSPLLIDSRNSAKILVEGNLRLVDSRYQNRFHTEGYVARRSILGDLNYSAATVEMDNRLLLSRETKTILEWKLKGGNSWGQLPVEEYFTLGVDTHSGNLLRAHPAARRGHYGNSPMGTSFAMSNLDIERRLTVLPLFNALNIPFLDVKALAFIDGGKTFDRARIFKQGTLFIDTGAGLKFETPSHSFNLIYGRSLRDGNGDRNVFAAYIEKRW